MKPQIKAGILAFAASLALYAHGDAEHIMGVARAVTADSVTVVTAKNEVVTVLLRPGTEIRRSNVKARITDLKAGDRVVIHAEKNKAGKFEAEEVEFRSAAK